jgi:type IV pilus assembly protein PilB
VRRICQHCKHAVTASDQLLEASGLSPEEHRHRTFHEGKGCIECNGTGFRGRSAIAELLDLSDRIREAILGRKSAAEIRNIAKEEGMLFLRDSALAKAFAGETTLREINKVTFVE